DIGEPAVAVRHVAVDDGEEPALQCLSYRSTTPRSDSDPVDRADRGHFGSGPDDEHLVGNIQSFTWHVGLDDRITEVAGECEDRVARDAAEDRGADRRGENRAVPDEEDVLPAALADVPVHVERNALGIPIGERLHL